MRQRVVVSGVGMIPFTTPSRTEGYDVVLALGFEQMQRGALYEKVG